MARRNKRAERDVARERVERLVELAQRALREGHLARAKRYGELAWRVKTTYQLRASAVDTRVCRACHGFLSSTTARVRVRDGVRITTCLACGHVRRKPLTPRADRPAAAETSPVASG